MQSAGQVTGLSLPPQKPSPHTGPLGQSTAQLAGVSPTSHAPLPHTGPLVQSTGQLATVSPGWQKPSPHIAVTQSAGQLSPTEQVPSPHTGPLVQSRAQLVLFSPLSQLPLPQTGHDWQAPIAEPTARAQNSPGPQLVSLVQPGVQVGKPESSQNWPALQVVTPLQSVWPVRPGAPQEEPGTGVGPQPARKNSAAAARRREIRMVVMSFPHEDAGPRGPSRLFFEDAPSFARFLLRKAPRSSYVGPPWSFSPSSPSSPGPSRG